MLYLEKDAPLIHFAYSICQVKGSLQVKEKELGSMEQNFSWILFEEDNIIWGR